MAQKILCLLILCGILCLHQILGEDSSDAPFVVSIRKTAGHVTICVGVILSIHTVITSSNCVTLYNSPRIEVLSGSSDYNLGTRHEVIMKNFHMGDHERGNTDGIAFLIVEPAFVFDKIKTAPIELYQGPLLPGTNATIFSWGHNPTGPRRTDDSTRLRSITVPIIDHGKCVNSYLDRFSISSINDICTFPENKKCDYTDAGAPLVIQNRLAGIHLWRYETTDCVLPDVFVNLQSSEYGPWIKENIVHNVVNKGG